MLLHVVVRAAQFMAFRLNPVWVSRKMGVKLGGNVHIYGGSPRMWSTEPHLIDTGNNVYITDGVVSIGHDGGTLTLRRDVLDLQITTLISVGNNVYTGLRAMILAGIRIGNRVIIGAGSIVTKDIPDNPVVAGVPARFIKTVDQYLRDLLPKSLRLGHLPAREKEQALRKLFGSPSQGGEPVGQR
ncbi:acyltransferase [Geothrix oryzisoli]|uniref:acyltransferase n=1 Tax=Geothrix oryzisoli TaxID=2922721 RepID=UPI001FAC1DBF|nr:acyltransferase [Geothrix oryzisoli]